MPPRMTCLIIRDVIGDDPDVCERRNVFHSLVHTKTAILVYYLSQSVQKQQSCALNCRLGVRLTQKLEICVFLYCILVTSHID